jgi:sulfur relay (sulfurtransferase) complex TusBCD TusD component (DsrE family)
MLFLVEIKEQHFLLSPIIMKKLLIIALLGILLQPIYAEQPLACEQYSVFNKKSKPDLGIVLYTNDAETVWNALRLATYSQGKGDTVVIFLLGKGLDGFQTKDKNFDLEPLKDKFMGNGGQVIACATCAEQRKTDEISMCTIASLADLYQIVKQSKKVLTF